MPTHSNGSGCVPMSPPWQPRGLRPPAVHTRDGGTAGVHSRGCGIAPGATTLPPPCRQPPPGCHIPPEAASLLATLTPPLPAVLPALLRCPRPAHVCMHVRAACSPPAFCTRGVAFFTGAVCILHRGGGSCIFHRGCFRFAPVGGCISHQRCFHFALEGAVAFSTWDACFLHQWCCPFCTGGSSCILHQGHLHFILVGFAFCTRDACFLHW